MDTERRFVNRDLSWLAFNERVLEEAEDAANPLLERLRFVAIFEGNLAEFNSVRVAGIRRLVDAGYSRKDESGIAPEELLEEALERIAVLRARVGRVYGRLTARELPRARIALKRRDDLDPRQRKVVSAWFESDVHPVVTPLAVDQGHPFPRLPSGTLCFAVLLRRYRTVSFAVVPVPGVISRVLRLPSARDEHQFILLDEVLRAGLPAFFRGYRIVEAALFRVIRDGELFVEEEYADDLLEAIEAEVKKRPVGLPVSVEVERGASRALVSRLAGEIGIESDAAARVEREVDLTFLFDLIGRTGRRTLLYPDFTPAHRPYADVFDRVRKGAVLVHLPYQSIRPVIDLLESAAVDPAVLAVKMTLYRTNDDSAFVAALARAARNGKQVTVLVELKARFDEERNIVRARELEKAGCHVVYGIPGVKIHSKILLVVRREEDGIRRYVHLSTGNYNEKTARVYTDIGLITADEEFGRDASDVFNVITGRSLPPRWQKVISAPNDLRKYFMELMDGEIGNRKNGHGGEIFAKMNSLEDARIIEKLYDASCAGVKVRLIVRGICRLVPGVRGMSENIEVRSVVGRFLEHSRVYLFGGGGTPRAFLSSADWMTRNFDRRVELLFKVEDEEPARHLAWILETMWRDTVKARRMRPNGSYERVGGEPFNAQERLLEHYGQ